MCEDIGVTMVTNKLTIVMVTLSLKKDIESSSEMFGYLRTSSAIMLRNDCLALGQLLENLRKEGQVSTEVQSEVQSRLASHPGWDV